MNQSERERDELGRKKLPPGFVYDKVGTRGGDGFYHSRLKVADLPTDSREKMEIPTGGSGAMGTTPTVKLRMRTEDGVTYYSAGKEPKWENLDPNATIENEQIAIALALKLVVDCGYRVEKK